jgi:hypothetical protein
MNRRDFVVTGITAAGTAAVALPLGRTMPPNLTAVATGQSPPFAVIFDQRYAAAHAFADAMAWCGHKVFGYAGDITAVWVREIEPRWTRRAGALAGMSTRSALFCLEQLASQHWLRVVSRHEQPNGRSAPLVSWVIA